METIKSDVRKDVIQSDNSSFFSMFGSRKPEITIREEQDNQLSACPDEAGVKIINKPLCCDIITYNDGDTPTFERMEKMKFIGRTHSDKKGASICGVGQIEGLIAGRKTPKANGELNFKSINNGQESKFTCHVNGMDYTIKTENTGPWPTDERNWVEKTYSNMARIDDKKLELIKIYTAIKIHPYSTIHPGFIYKINDEIINPQDVLYKNHIDDSIKRKEEKRTVQYHNQKYEIEFGIGDFARYVKPDGKCINEERADDLDKFYNMGSESGGVFVEVGGSMVITGGKNSWDFIGDKYHSTHNGQRIYIKIPAHGELKDAIFAESPNKSMVGICLNDITDYNGEKIFEPITREIVDTINQFSKERESYTDDGLIKKEQQQKDYNDIMENEIFREHYSKAISALNETQKSIIFNKKVKTVYDDLAA